MLPVTGPDTTIAYSDPLGSYFGKGVQKTRYRQAKPYDLALPYLMIEHTVTSWSQQPSWQAANSSGQSYAKAHNIGNRLDIQAHAYAKARGRFNTKLGDSASVLISLAEREQAMSMLTKRITQVSRFVVSLKRLDFIGAARELGIKKPTKGLLLKSAQSKKLKGSPLSKRDRRQLAKWDEFEARLKAGKFKEDAKSYASNFLEFHFGWSPLVSDITSAMNILSGDIPFGTVRGTATARYTEKGTTGYYSDIFFQNTGSIRVAIQAEVSVSNPNLFLASRLGLLDLAAVPFELISYSFVFDWFVNVSEFLGQFTEFAGVTLAKLQHSIRYRSENSFTWASAFGPPTSGSSKGNGFQRIVGALPFIDLRVRQPWQLSPRRGLAAISLLIQKMR